MLDDGPDHDLTPAGRLRTGYTEMAEGMIKNNRAGSLFQRGQMRRIRRWRVRTTIAPFGIAELKIDRAEARGGETVTISFKATNTTDFTNIYPITLKINDEVVAAEVVSLPRKVAMPMKFTIDRTLPGNYKVDVNNSTGTFTVRGSVIENEIAKLEGVKTDISEVETSFDLNLVDSETPVRQRELLVKNVMPSPAGQKSIIYKIAGCIEFALDKIGDVIIFSIGTVVMLLKAIFKIVRRKAKTRP